MYSWFLDKCLDQIQVERRHQYHLIGNCIFLYPILQLQLLV